MSAESLDVKNVSWQPHRAKPKVTSDDRYNDPLNPGRLFNAEDRATAIVEGYRKEISDFKACLPIGNRPLRGFAYDSGGGTPFISAKYAMPTAFIEEAGGK
nr:hypothetical protein [uncultured Cohaesibacter sp.]